MKILLTMFLVVCISVGSQAQIEIPKDTIWGNTINKSINLDTLNVYKLGDVVNDSIVYTTDEYPWFIPVEFVDSIWNSKAYNSMLLNDRRYIADRTPHFDFLLSGALILRQNYLEQNLVLKDKNNGKKFWYLLKYAKNIGATPLQFIDNLQIDSIINPPIDTIATDTITP